MTLSAQFLSAQVILECHGDDLQVWRIFERHRISIVIDTITLLILLVKLF